MYRFLTILYSILAYRRKSLLKLAELFIHCSCIFLAFVDFAIDLVLDLTESS